MKRSVFVTEAFQDACDRPIIRILRFLTCATSTVRASTLPLVQNTLGNTSRTGADVARCPRLRPAFDLPLPPVAPSEMRHRNPPSCKLTQAPEVRTNYLRQARNSPSLNSFDTLCLFSTFDPPPVLYYVDLSTKSFPDRPKQCNRHPSSSLVARPRTSADLLHAVTLFLACPSLGPVGYQSSDESSCVLLRFKREFSAL
jgi:hypothetical protein